MTSWRLRLDSVEPEGSSSSRRVRNTRVKGRDPVPYRVFPDIQAFYCNRPFPFICSFLPTKAGSNTAAERCDRYATCTPREGLTPYSDASLATKGKPFVPRVASSAQDLYDLPARFKGPNDRSRLSLPNSADNRHVYVENGKPIST